MSDNNELIQWELLPSEIVTNILVRLPIKSIIICTCVSKAWKSLIQNPTFISTHLRYSHNKNLLFFNLCLENQKEFYALHNEDDEPDFTQHTSFDYPFLVPDPDAIFRVVGTCNGLLLCLSNNLTEGTSRLCLWNPSVRKLVNLPLTNFSSDACIGFGFDRKTNDYKVVRVVKLMDRLDLRIYSIYSLFTGEWRMLRVGLAPICALRHHEPHAFINGALHWVASRVTDNKSLYFILVFDLGGEVFREILPPEPIGHTGMMSAFVSVYKNSIALIQKDNNGFLHIWVMKEYGILSSWTKVLSLTISNQSYIFDSEDIPRVIGFRRNGEVVLKLDGGKLVSQDPESEEIKDLRIIGNKNTFVDPYVESLVLLDKAANRVVTY
ncbi:F-box protein At3g07870-like isoform X1 [Quercus lobata]|uniref:F-box domain-containing protein n=1 Tax=Quercus lobata TaxID=97700 RepID=A0A7N2M2Y2_QUELO|nr:F-box protein At3g07870-like isoform X1 [Quercus lobata]